MSRTIVSRVAFLLTLSLLTPAAAFAQPFEAVHGVDAVAYQAWFNRVTTTGYRPVYVNGYDAGGRVAFAGVAVKDANPPLWEARHGLTLEEFQKAFDATVGRGFRPICVSGYHDAGTARFAALFVND